MSPKSIACIHHEERQYLGYEVLREGKETHFNETQTLQHKHSIYTKITIARALKKPRERQKKSHSFGELVQV